MVVDQPMEVQVAPISAPYVNVVQEVFFEVYSIRDSSSEYSSINEDDIAMDLVDEKGRPPIDEPIFAVVPSQEVDIVEVIPQAPAGPISILSDDDGSVSDHRVYNIVSDWLRWQPAQQRTFFTRPESRTLRRYIRYLRSQIHTMRLWLQVRIDQLRRYHGDIFDSNFDFGMWGYRDCSPTH